MSSQAPTLRQGDVIAKKYEVEASLGGGPSGVTYAARAINGGRRVAVRLLHGPAADPNTVADLVRRLKQAEGEGLTRIIETGDYRGWLYIAEEFVEGDSLRRLMDSYAGQKRSFTMQEAGQIIVRLLDALEKAHDAGVLHRHIKPTSVVVKTKQVGPGRAVHTPVLCGTGYSELVHVGVLQENLAIAEKAHTRYLAPEMSSPTAGGSRQGDIYSVGVLLYELLVGQTPQGTYISPSQVREDLPQHIDDVVDLALARNPEDRYPSARDMINDIQRCFTEEAPVQSGISRRTLAMIVGGSAVAFAVVLAGFYLLDPDKLAVNKDQALRAQLIEQNPLPSEAEVQAKLASHPDMVWIPAGTFAMGRMNAEKDVGSTGEPLAAVTEAQAYYIDRFEWPNQKSGFPIVRATYADAEAQCATAGKRLCTAIEWERACKGPEMLHYAYGNEFSMESCGADVVPDGNGDGRGDLASGKLEKCVSGFGVYDLSGGAREWTSSEGSADKKKRIVKGGKRGNAAVASRCAYGDDQRVDYTDATVSFRCCLDDK